jgi:peptidoglycan hydrolase-like protein with peptidoglycan-binding domain
MRILTATICLAVALLLGSAGVSWSNPKIFDVKLIGSADCGFKANVGVVKIFPNNYQFKFSDKKNKPIIVNGKFENNKLKSSSFNMTLDTYAGDETSDTATFSGTLISNSVYGVGTSYFEETGYGGIEFRCVFEVYGGRVEAAAPLETARDNLKSTNYNREAASNWNRAAIREIKRTNKCTLREWIKYEAACEQAGASKEIGAQGRGSAVSVTEKIIPAVAAVQEALQILDLYFGKLDGISGSKTSAAIQRWQKRNGYPETGEITEKQFFKLEHEAKTLQHEVKELARREEKAKDIAQMEMADVQKALQVLDLYSGKIDGIIGPKTRSAIRRWQKRNGYPQNGEITDIQIIKLEQEAKPNKIPSLWGGLDWRIRWFIYLTCILFIYIIINRRSDIHCTWCRRGIKDLKYLNGNAGGLFWEFRNKDGSRDKRVKDNYEIASFTSIWQCQHCDAVSKYQHYVSQNPSKEAKVWKGELVSPGKCERTATDYNTSKAGEDIDAKSANRKKR